MGDFHRNKGTGDGGEGGGRGYKRGRDVMLRGMEDGREEDMGKEERTCKLTFWNTAD